MAAITDTLIFEAVKRHRQAMTGMKEGWRETPVRLNAMQSDMIALRQGIRKSYAIPARHDACLDRIERRLNILESA